MSVAYTIADACARITLADPARRNVIDGPVIAALLQAGRQAREDGAKVIVLSAEGPHFSAGGDLAAIGRAEDPGRHLADAVEDFHTFIAELWQGEAVVISSVRGQAIGGGFSLAAAADVVIAADTATFTLAYTGVAMSVDGGASMLVNSLGLHTALRLALLNDTMNAEEARHAGLVARVVADSDLDATTARIAQAMAAGPAPALASARRLFRTASQLAPISQLRAEAIALRDCARTTEGREGIAAFLERRPPRYGN